MIHTYYSTITALNFKNVFEIFISLSVDEKYTPNYLKKHFKYLLSRLDTMLIFFSFMKLFLLQIRRQLKILFVVTPGHRGRAARTRDSAVRFSDLNSRNSRDSRRRTLWPVRNPQRLKHFFWKIADLKKVVIGKVINSTMCTTIRSTIREIVIFYKYGTGFLEHYLVNNITR